ncbi:MAG: ThiF family adenylyltransferase [Desulfovibrio sp.]|jgi:adenylyltransferase/sulfurtransferase|nr:ThiF family adenylyltransferase [Desulfovibrio sp.]
MDEEHAADPLPDLSREEILRYSRHLVLPEVGIAGQKKLKKSSVLLVGAGGLGSPVGLYLAAAGVGSIGFVDHDRVESSNLQRQILHGTADVGRLKTASARDAVLRINPNARVSVFDLSLNSANALEILEPFDIIVDGSDNFAARYLINDACALLGKPDVYGAVYRSTGQAAVFDAKRGACLRCLMPEAPVPEEVRNCGDGGVLGVLPCIVGGIQAAEVIKLILGASSTLINRYLTFDAWTMRFHTFSLDKKPSCPLCGDRPEIREPVDYEVFCGVSRKREEDAACAQITPAQLKKLLDTGADIQIVDVRFPEEIRISALPGSVSIPLQKIGESMGLLDPTRDAVLVCRKGEKSLTAAFLLREEGYRGRLLNLEGGINAWAEAVDPSLPVY